MKKYLLTLLVCALVFTACEKPAQIEGLWLVTSVQVGEEEMTPNARWMRFNADHTQQSGNGWFQHSVGNWEYNSNTHELSISNHNGLKDPYAPFQTSFSENGMQWIRTEEGEQVTVKLERTEQLPTTYGDKLLGLWKLKKAVGEGSYFSEKISQQDYLFLRWDKRFVVGKEEGRIHGVYQVNGHRPQVDFFPYNKEYDRVSWDITLEGDQIVLTNSDADSAVSRTFTRIHEFPN